MKTLNYLKSEWAAIISGNSFVLACHQRPDGDTLGSALGLAHVLRNMGKEVLVIAEDGIPENYRFVPESDLVVRSTDKRGFDVGLIIDSESPRRVGSAADVILSAKKTGCIDHHIPHTEFGEIRVVDHKASSTAEVVVGFLDANDVEIDKTAATQFLTGLISDTGAFRFANTMPKTFHIAARLTDAGAQPSIIAREVYDSKPLRATKLLGKALCALEMDESGFVVWATITKADMDSLGATDADTDSIVNQVSAVKGPKVAILFREIKANTVRISLRSRDGIDVNRIARVFGGGGHAAAAGCTVEAPIAEAEKKVVDEVLKWTES